MPSEGLEAQMCQGNTLSWQQRGCTHVGSELALGTLGPAVGRGPGTGAGYGGTQISPEDSLRSVCPCPTSILCPAQAQLLLTEQLKGVCGGQEFSSLLGKALRTGPQRLSLTISVSQSSLGLHGKSPLLSTPALTGMLLESKNKSLREQDSAGHAGLH